MPASCSIPLASWIASRITSTGPRTRLSVSGAFGA